MKPCRIAIVMTIAFASPVLAQSGDRGERDFQACVPCHSLEPDRNMTGPSLANLWGRKAGSLPSFDRYSDALKASGIILGRPFARCLVDRSESHGAGQ